MVAREYAWKEKVTEGEWMSEEQLLDVLKSEANTKNYIKSCKAQGLMKHDRMQDCKVYFFMKKLERMGKREEAGRAEEWHGKKKGVPKTLGKRFPLWRLRAEGPVPF